MNLYNNFKLIDKWQIPHPKWEFVKSSKNLKKFYQTKDYCGWTIRVLFTKGEEFRLPIYTNWLAKDKVLAKVDQFSKKAKKDFVIAVYPSWKLYKSGTLLIEPKRIIIEACKGHVAELMREGNCQLRLIYSSDKKLKESSGDGKFLNSNERQKILKSTNKISRKNIILEWAIGQEKEFIFYKLEDLKEAGKKLLEKYS